MNDTEEVIEPMSYDGDPMPRQEYLSENIELLTEADEGEVICPACGEPFAHVGAEGGFSRFKAICSHCDSPVFLVNGVVLTDGLGTERSHARATVDKSDNPTATLDELREHVTSKWERRIAEGDIGRETMEVCATDLGWDWEPPEHLGSKPGDDTGTEDDE